MKREEHRALVGLAVFLAAAMGSVSRPAAGGDASVDAYLKAVTTFADKVLEHGRDGYGPKHTPLFVDGLNVDTLEPAKWQHKGEAWILSNQASQQNLFRTLDGLSKATGEPKYREAAVEAIRYMFEHLQDKGGMLHWGGHRFYDALGDRPVGEGVKHEFKHHYPYYDLMWQVNPEATRRLIEGVWNAHVIRWDILDVNRHGSYGRKRGKLWDHVYKGGKVPFVGRGLSFMMSGTDFICAAAMLSKLTGNDKPMVWAKRLAKRYVEARHPETGLGASNFSVMGSRRMEKQFAHFNGRFTEATVTDLYGARYTYCAICQLRLGETLGEPGNEFLQWGLEDLAACAAHTYDEKARSFWPTLIDGTKLTPADRRKAGYVSVRWLQKRPADTRHFLAYALAYKLSRKPLMWRMTRSIGQALGLGDLGEQPGKPGAIPTDTASSDPLILFGLLELHEATRQGAYLDLAKRLGDHALTTRFRNGFVVESGEHLYSRFDDPLPLALLHLRAAVLGLKERPPAFWCGRGYFHCPYDGKGRTYDVRVLYPQRRAPAPAR